MAERGCGIHSPIQAELLSAGIRCLVRTEKVSVNDVAEAIGVESKLVVGWVQHGALPGDTSTYTRLCDYVITQCQLNNDLRFFVTLMGGMDENWRVPHLILDICTTVFGIDSLEFRRHSDLLSGEYLCQRYSPEKHLITEWLNILPFNESEGIARFTNQFKTTHGDYASDGYIIPAQNALFLCGIVHSGRQKPYPRFIIAHEVLNKRLRQFTAVLLDTDHFAFPIASRMICTRQNNKMTDAEKDSAITFRSMTDLTESEQAALERSIGSGPLIGE